LQILLLHLSDLHIRSDHDAILSRASQIKAACHGIAPNATACVIVLSGDIAYSGLASQYELAYQFLSEIGAKLNELPSIKSVEFIAVPGNHDCDFSNESDIRQYLLKDVQALYESAIDPSSDRAKAILEVQKAFFAFEARLNRGKEISVDQRLSYGRIVAIDNFLIAFQCYNTAWLSRIHDQQAMLFLPDDAIEPLATHANICASVFHHPYNWLDANNYRALKDAVEQTSDLVFTGHEHSAGGGGLSNGSQESICTISRAQQYKARAEKQTVDLRL
jgi:3',5'-cyclic AMP phosphodiesterase CpdA